MAELRLCLFGAPRLMCAEQSIKIDTWKALALLAWLALNDGEHSREVLAAMFWPEQNETQARGSLRRALWTLRQALAANALTGDKQTVRFHPPAGFVVDVLEFEKLVAAANRAAHVGMSEPMQKLRAAVALYRADFLVGFTLPDCPLFDEWQFFTAERLRQILADALQRLIDWDTVQQNYPAAIEAARHWLTLDALHEPAHRRLMQLYTWSGQQSAALRQYEACRQRLQQELDAPPEAETEQLYATILGHRLAPPLPRTESISPSPALVRHNLPTPLSPLLGRDLELNELDLLMIDRSERLITITGPGGMGKTRLALSLAERHLAANRLRDGVCFIGLAAIDDVQAIVPALMSALGLSSEGSQASADKRQRQVLDFLAAKQMLLIFDNFEQVLEGRTLLIEILTATPAVHLLVTSRERLHLRDEQVYPISGLACPVTIGDQDAPALALFLRMAQRAQPHFQPGAVELEHLVRICHLVAGLPLALELAAGWVHLLAPAAIADALQTNLDLLESTLHDMPLRHRSMRAAFDTTWHLLAEDERQIFAQLSLFRGGFTHEAAAQVTGATLKQLKALADKSLIEYRRTVDRFEIHELLRQYGAEKLFAIGRQKETHARHLSYFLHLAETTEPHLRGRDRVEWMRALANEHYNLRLAFDCACTAEITAQALRLAGALLPYWLGHGVWAEGAHCVATALALYTADIATNDELGADRRSLAKVFYAAGLFAWHQPDYARAKACTEESLRLYQHLEDELGCAQAFHLLGLTARAQRDFPEAMHYFTVGLNLARKYADRLLMATILNDMGAVAWRQNDFVKASRLFEESLTYYQAELDTHGVALNVYDLGLVACWQGDLERAHIFGERSLAAFRQLADPLNTAQALGLLALVAMYQNELDKAQALFEQALACYQTLSAQRSIAITLLRLGHVRRRQRNLAGASQLVGEATVLLRRIGDPLNLIHALEAWSSLAVAYSQFEMVARLYGTVSAWRTRLGTPRPPVELPEYDHQFTTVRAALGESLFETAWAEGGKLSLDQALEYALSSHRRCPVPAAYPSCNFVMRAPV